MSTHDASNGTPSPRSNRPAQVRGIAVVAAAAFAVIMWLVATQVFDVDLVVRPGGGDQQHVGVASVVFVTVITSLIGWLLLFLLERRTERAAKVWTIAAVVVLVVSLAGPLTADADGSVTAVLVGMHLAVAAVVIPAFASSTKQGRSS